MSEGYKRHSHEHRKDLAGEHRWGDTGQIIMLIIFIIGMILDMFLLKISDSLQTFIPWYYRLLLFLIPFFAAGYFSQNAHKKIFKEERKDLIVIENDVYGMLRHPMYFGAILVYLSFVVLSFSAVAMVIFVLIVIFYYYLCRYEERILIEKLGDKYCNYMKKVPMLFPKFKKS